MSYRFAILSICLISTGPSFAHAQCGTGYEEANSAIARAHQHMVSNNDKAAVTEAKSATAAADDCAAAFISLANAYNARFSKVDGLAALTVSRGFRSALARALELDPENIEMRALEIGYLRQAPRSAGGSKAKALDRLTEFEALDPAVAAPIRLAVARDTEDNEQIVAALKTALHFEPEKLESQSELARRLIIVSKRYEEGEAVLLGWDELQLTEHAIAERLLLRGVWRVQSETELPQAEAFLSEFIELRGAIESSALEPISRAYAYLGDARRFQGDMDAARSAYEYALEENPDEQRAIQGLSKLN